MVLGIGIVVDDAIVVVENVERVMSENPELDPKTATKQAMAQITGPVIAISLVLLSVFVPIGFIPGVSGTLFRQFAVTISVAMLISAINALTLSPALCGVFLRHHGHPRGPLGWMLNGIIGICDGYAATRAAVVARLHFESRDHRRLGRGHLVSGETNADRFSCRKRIRARSSFRSSCPMARRCRARATVVAAGRGTGPADAAGRGLAVDRRLLAAGRRQSVERRVRGRAAQAVSGPARRRGQREGGDRPGVRRRQPDHDRRIFSRSACRRSSACRPVAASNTSLENLEGREPAEMASVMGGLLGAANQDPRLSRVFATFTAANPSIWLDIDRDKAQALGVGVSDVFNTLQTALGGFYINDLNLYGRTWQVILQAEAADRSDVVRDRSDFRARQGRAR